METEFLDWLLPRLPPHRQMRLGPGDDAAVLQLARDGQCVVTVDLLSDGVDFQVTNDDPRRIGRKALAVNLSDLAAMAARPVAAFVAVALPRSGALALAKQLYEGILPLAEKYDVAIAGGDTNTHDGPLSIGITLFGEPTARGVWRRSGAKPGDAVLVTGQFGGSILGRHFDFEPRVREALALAERFDIHAAIDASDSLSLDLARLCRASGLGAVVDMEQIPIAPAACELAKRNADGRNPLQHALEDGEDFELILAATPDVAQAIVAEQPLEVALTRIGQFIEEPGLWHSGQDGARIRLEPCGYVH